MAANRIENAGGTAAEKGMAGGGAAGGIKPWLPLIVALVAMPALSFVTTKFMLLPMLQAHGPAGDKEAGEASASESGGHGGGEKGGKEGLKGPKKFFPLDKVMVNVSISGNTRYLMGSFTLVGTRADFEEYLKANKPQLLDLAQGVLSTKTIADLEKQGIRNLVRNELISVFNNALGGNPVKEIYITEFAVQ